MFDIHKVNLYYLLWYTCYERRVMEFDEMVGPLLFTFKSGVCLSVCVPCQCICVCLSCRAPVVRVRLYLVSFFFCWYFLNWFWMVAAAFSTGSVGLRGAAAHPLLHVVSFRLHVRRQGTAKVATATASVALGKRSEFTVCNNVAST
ncbi:hypothetical protein J4Q44_G00331230 [Coregonus suidteri]|uniref:Uncharacterized protein n=1 Tax=Coregonus suidteri TaxID=861788 RepID=A0AAN8L1V5_9TELE